MRPESTLTRKEKGTTLPKKSVGGRLAAFLIPLCPLIPKASDKEARLVKMAGSFLAVEATARLKKALFVKKKNAQLRTQGLPRMCYGCCYLFIAPPTCRKDLELLTIKTELDLYTESK